jgi:hypothetical protein
VVLGDPEALVAQSFGLNCEHGRLAKSLRRGRARRNRGEFEYGEGDHDKMHLTGRAISVECDVHLPSLAAACAIEPIAIRRRGRSFSRKDRNSNGEVTSWPLRHSRRAGPSRDTTVSRLARWGRHPH